MIKPPVAQKKLVELVKHDTTRIDNYFWLNQPDDQEVIDYLNAENEYTSHMLNGFCIQKSKMFHPLLLVRIIR